MTPARRHLQLASNNPNPSTDWTFPNAFAATGTTASIAASGVTIGTYSEESGYPFQAGSTNLSPIYAQFFGHTEEPSQAGAKAMADDPITRTEIAAQLGRAEERTDRKFAELRGEMKEGFSSLDHKIDSLGTKIDLVIGAIEESSKESREDNKHTRRAMWEVGLGAVIAVLVLVVTLWIAGINVQGNLLSAFQAGLATLSVHSGK